VPGRPILPLSGQKQGRCSPPSPSLGTCSLAGEQGIDGRVNLKLGTGQTEEVSQALEGLGSSEGNLSLIIDKNNAYIEGGKTLLSLASGSKFSFR
jgi:hypothetical protein